MNGVVYMCCVIFGLYEASLSPSCQLYKDNRNFAVGLVWEWIYWIRNWSLWLLSQNIRLMHCTILKLLRSYSSPNTAQYLLNLMQPATDHPFNDKLIVVFSSSAQIFLSLCMFQLISLFLAVKNQIRLKTK